MKIVVSAYVYRIIFLSLIVSSLFCNFNRCAVCFQSVSEHRLQEVLKMPRVANAFEDYTLIKPLNKNNHTKFFIMLKCNSVNGHSNTTTARSAKVRTGRPFILGDFGIFFLTV